jgi:ComF family protein
MHLKASKAFDFLLFPYSCASCGEALDITKDNGICERCMATCLPLAEPFCMICGHQFPCIVNAASHVCETCIKSPRHFDRARSIFRYEGGIKAMLLKMKFHNSSYAARVIVNLAKTHMQKIIKELPDNYVLMPIPLHKRRLFHRGFNQSEILASGLFPKDRIWKSTLLRKVHNRSQRGLSKKDRMKNVKNVFTLKQGKSIAGCNVVLFDDIYTTGATLDSASKILKKAGAETVYAITLARAVL